MYGLDPRGRIVDLTPSQLAPKGPFVRARKECSRCREVKPDLDFSLDMHRSDGLCHVCKECQRSARSESVQFERGDVERETTGSVCWAGNGHTGRSR